jgi:hypothetical protein
MKTLFQFGLILLCAVPASTNELWSNAVDLYDSYGELVPGELLIEFSQYNGSGEHISTEESLLRFTVGADGEPESELIWARKDGEDVTEERRENPQGGSPFGGGPGGGDDGEEDGNAFSGLQKSPFDPAEQSNVEIEDTGRIERVGGIRARRFDFVHKTGPDSSNVGTAWLTPDTGMPVKIELTLSQLPFYIESLSMRQYFGRDEQDRWISTALEFDGVGRVLFFRREIVSRLEFSDYFRLP